MSISDKDVIFKFYEPGEYAPQQKIAYYGWHGDILSGFWAYFSGFELAAKSLYKDFINGDNGTKDYIIYPLFFNYRHMVELIIKYMYFKFSCAEEGELKAFLNNGHNLYKCWLDTKKHIQPLLDRQKSDFDLSSVDHYIKEMNKQDPLSFNMRYPISKNLKPVHKSGQRLDIDNFSKKMNNFVMYVKSIESEINNQLIGFRYDIQIQNKIIDMYLNSFDYINGYLCFLKKVEIEKLSENYTKTYAEACKSSIKRVQALQSGEDIHMNMLTSIPDRTLELIFLLYYSGRELSSNLIKLTKIENEIFKDFITLMISIMDDFNILLDGKCYRKDEFIGKLWGTNPRRTIEYLETALKYFDHISSSKS